MDYLTCKLVYPYLNKNYYTIYKLVSRDFRDNINQDKVITPYSVLTSKSLLCYSSDILNLVYDRMLKVTIIIIGDLDSIKYQGRIAFSGFCEPLLSKNLDQYIAKIKKKLNKTIIEIVSNGDPLLGKNGK